MVEEIYNTDALTVPCDMLCHQVNCLGVMGAGIARQIKKQLLSKEDFETYQNLCKESGGDLLGSIYWVPLENKPAKSVINVFGQKGVGAVVETNYEALKKAFVLIESLAEDDGLTIVVPGFIGCGLAGGDWNIVRDDILVPIFKDSNATLKIVYFDSKESCGGF